MMDLDQLQSVRDRERQTDKLQELSESFYGDVGEFVQELHGRREQAAERADNPYDAPEVRRLTDEIEAAEQTVEALYEKRVGKIVEAASFAAADLPAGNKGMTTEERELFETLVEDITANRRQVLDVLTGDDPDQPAETGRHTSPAGEAGAGDSTDETVDVADAMGGTGSTPRGDGPPSADGGSQSSEPGTAPRGRGSPDDGATTAAGTAGETGGVAAARETVRVTADVGLILGVDEREYDLSEGDVVQLPAANATPLVERGAAERLE